jgi:hypothetical protein
MGALRRLIAVATGTTAVTVATTATVSTVTRLARGFRAAGLRMGVIMSRVAPMATMHRAFPEIAAASHAKERDELFGFFSLAFRALACVWVRARSDLLELEAAGSAKIFVKRHTLFILAPEAVFVANWWSIMFKRAE